MPSKLKGRRPRKPEKTPQEKALHKPIPKDPAKLQNEIDGVRKWVAYKPARESAAARLWRVGIQRYYKARLKVLRDAQAKL